MNRIEAVELWELDVPLQRPFVTSAGAIESRRVGLLRIAAGDHEGWGEFSPVSGHTTGTFDEARSALELAAPSLVGLATDSQARPPVVVPSALAAIEAALWDVDSRIAGSPLWSRLGGQGGEVVAGSVISLAQDPADATAEAVADGYRHVKVKIAPGNDVARLAPVRESNPELLIGADANGAYSPDDAAPLEDLDDLGLAYLEQPFPVDGLQENLALDAKMSTPVCLDEGVHTVAEAQRAIAAGLAVTVKPAALGGLARALEIHSTASKAGVPIRVGGLLETGVGRAFAASLATLAGFSLPSDLSLPSRYLADDPSVLGWELRGPKLVAPAAPGAGFDVDRDAVERLAVEQLQW